MKSHKISLHGRGDVCSRSSGRMALEPPFAEGEDPEVDFEIALMEALSSKTEGDIGQSAGVAVSR